VEYLIIVMERKTTQVVAPAILLKMPPNVRVKLILTDAELLALEQKPPEVALLLALIAKKLNGLCVKAQCYIEK